MHRGMFYHTEVKCPRPPYDTQEEIMCSVHKVTFKIDHLLLTMKNSRGIGSSMHFVVSVVADAHQLLEL